MQNVIGLLLIFWSPMLPSPSRVHLLRSKISSRNACYFIRIFLMIYVWWLALSNIVLLYMTSQTNQNEAINYVNNSDSSVSLKLARLTSSKSFSDNINKRSETKENISSWHQTRKIYTNTSKKSQPLDVKQSAVVPSNLSELPEALQPLTFLDCCPMISFDRAPKKPKCGEVCLTHQVCNDTLYPFSSLEEKNFLRREKALESVRAQCQEMNALMQPPYQWCQQWISQSVLRNGSAEMHTIDPYVAKIPPPGCSIFNNGGGSGPFQHLILFPKAKMAFCGIPKVGITQWMQFLRFTLGAKDYLSTPHIKPEVFAMRFDKINQVAQMKILNDPEWKFVTFLRDPAERLLSAYLDKVATKRHEQEHFKRMHGLNTTLSFDQFLDILGEEQESCPIKSENHIDRLKGIHWCTNPHWRPQTFSCGLSEFLPRFSYVGSLNYIETQARVLLEEFNLWDDYGRWYHWDDNRTRTRNESRCNSKPPELVEGQILNGFQQHTLLTTIESINDIIQPSDTVYGHSTNSKSKLTTYYYSPHLIEKVKQLYSNDYKLWDLVNQETLFSGEELATKIAPACQASSMSKI